MIALAEFNTYATVDYQTTLSCRILINLSDINFWDCSLIHKTLYYENYVYTT